MADSAAMGAPCNAVAAAVISVDLRAKLFGNQPILGTLSFSIERGETVALVGPSGIGKSTLLRIVAGLDNDFSGSVRRPDALAMVFQEPTLLPWRNALDNLRLIHPEVPLLVLNETLAEVGLSEKAGLFPGQLSLGQQRRLALARAFAPQPAALIMDEPFASLDNTTLHAMLDLTRWLIAVKKPATLFVTHSLQEAEYLADRVLTLQAGPSGAVLVDS